MGQAMVPAQGRPGQVRVAEVRPAEDGAPEPGAAQVRAPQALAREVGPAQVGVPQVGARQGDPGPRRAAPAAALEPPGVVVDHGLHGPVTARAPAGSRRAVGDGVVGHLGNTSAPGFGA